MANSNSKITQIKLTNTSYDIDVASSLKDTNPQADSTNVIISGALYNEQEARIAADALKLDKKPDGSISLLDENNKLNSHYISDTILGQLKFGGTISVKTVSSGDAAYTIAPSTLFTNKVLEVEALKETPLADGFTDPYLYASVSATPPIVFLGTWDNVGTSPLFANNLENVEGFYFIMAEDISALASVIPESKVGDWWIFCNGKIEKIDNTDTITHIDETDYNSLLEITGSSGLKLNGFSRYPDTVSVSLDTDLYSASDITTTGTINAGLVSTSQVSASSIDAGEIFASNRMTAPTITNKTDKTQVVNLEYFENNATKVDWENIDSEVQVINDHNVEINGGLIVHGKTDNNILEVTSEDQIENASPVEITSLATEVSYTFEPYVPFEDVEHPRWIDDGEEFSDLDRGPLNAPYWVSFPVKANNLYRIVLNSNSNYYSYFMTPVNFLETNSADQLVVFAPTLGGTLSCVLSTYYPTEQDTEYSRKGELTFTAPQDGFAYVAFNNSTGFDSGGSTDTKCAFIYEAPQGSPAKVKVSGDLEVTGDLSFGADSHLVFGTIEGTDFIADYAKVKNAPTEADDVVNKAYFDANKGSGGGTATLAAAGSSSLPVYIDSNGAAQPVSNLILGENPYGISGGTVAIYGGEGGIIYLGNTATGDGNVIITGSGHITLDPNNYFGDAAGITIQGKKVLVEGDAEGLPSGATEGAFLRYKSGAAVWEVIPSAEGNTF